MPHEGQQRRTVRDRNRSQQVLATDREVLLARLLLRVCDIIPRQDADQDFIDLYNQCKFLAEGVVRA